MTNNIQNMAISSAAYLLSAYALIITITGTIRCVQMIRKKELPPLLKKAISIPVVGRLISEHTFRTQVSLYPGFFINVIEGILITSANG